MVPLTQVPEATVARLPLYLRSLSDLGPEAAETVSSDTLAELTGVTAAKVRKDLSYLGTYGTRGVGYDVVYLRFAISQTLGESNTWPVVVCGMGNLGRALANHSGFTERGFPVVAATDTDPDKIGRVIDGVPVYPPSQMAQLVADHRVSIGVVATPISAAQGAADALVGAGVGSIMNFAPVVLSVPPGVDVRAVDLATELQILGFHLHRQRFSESA